MKYTVYGKDGSTHTVNHSVDYKELLKCDFYSDKPKPEPKPKAKPAPKPKPKPDSE